MNKVDSKIEQIPFKMHPRVFAALGADLVTNDVVAVIELVKNAYDAYATRVDVRFGTDPKKGKYLEVMDNGYGMGRETIRDVWCMVATPFRVENPVSKKGKRVRRASGEKGLGRLSAARLGNTLEMLTKVKEEACWKVSVDWSDLSLRRDIKSCNVRMEHVIASIPFISTGTLVRIFDLKSEWDDLKVEDLRDNLSRLVSPFATLDDFKIFLIPPGCKDKSLEVEISAPEFISKPKYAIHGHVNTDGIVNGKYKHSPMQRGKPRSTDLYLTWDQIVNAPNASEELKKLKGVKPNCGMFKFEIRSWDIGPDDTEEIADTFDINKSSIRKAIKVHKGISIYRDGILVLPKSEDARDWLGLDLRRVSKVGTRLSTSQIVGYVSISAKKNPNIEDTSDRERLVNNDSLVAFQGILKAIVSQLENERDKDRQKPDDKEQLSELFEKLTADDLLAELISIADEDAPATDAIPMLEEFNKNLNSVRKAIKKRFTYYSRLATVGTIAQAIVHEIRNRTTIFGSLVRYVSEKINSLSDRLLPSKIKQATNAVESLEQLADKFAPLASRAFRRRRRNSIIEESIQGCLSLSIIAKEIEELDIEVSFPTSRKHVAVDPAELDIIILNLILNSVYWLRQVKRKRRLEFRISRVRGGKRVKLSVHDSGLGIPKDDAKKIFLPGVTRKPGGIGMGLTVACELVAAYGGQMYLTQPGKLGGASLTFDVPLKL